MDKAMLLQAFARAAVEQSLDADLVRLFLLLLADGDLGGHGQLAYRTVRKALGPDYSPEDLKAACRELERRNFIEIISVPATARPLELTVRYRLVPIGGNFQCKGGSHD